MPNLIQVRLFVTRILCLSCTLGLAACSEPPHWKFGFVGGLSGPASDLGGPARNGMQLAIEEANANGGIRGRTIQANIKDDKQDPKLAVQMVEELLADKVDVIIGPVTSSIALEVIPVANTAKKVMMGLTVTTSELNGLDDYFLRVLSSTDTHAGYTAQKLYHKAGVRSVTCVYDLRNQSYSQGWIEAFTKRFQEIGGITKNILSFSSQNRDKLLGIADQLLEESPDMIVFVTNAVDAAMLAKLVRDKDAKVKIATSEWAGTERLIELGGAHIEGAYVPQYLDRESRDLDFQRFRSAYKKRFNQEPGFPGMTGYNATHVIISALRDNPDPDSLKQTILRQKQYTGIQGEIVFDQYGDVTSNTYVTQVQNGIFRVLNNK